MGNIMHSAWSAKIMKSWKLGSVLVSVTINWSDYTLFFSDSVQGSKL